MKVLVTLCPKCHFGQTTHTLTGIQDRKAWDRTRRDGAGHGRLRTVFVPAWPSGRAESGLGVVAIGEHTRDCSRCKIDLLGDGLIDS